MPADLLAHPHRALERDELGIRLTVADVRTFLIRGRWVIAGVFLLTTLTAYSALSLMTELYEVRSALLVKLGRENLDAPVTARNAVLSTGVRREELGSEVQILQSSDLAAQVVDEIGLEAFRPYRVVPDSLLGKAKFYAKAALRWAKDRGTDALIALDLQKRLGERDMAIASITDKLAAEPQKDSDVILLRLRLSRPGPGRAGTGNADRQVSVAPNARAPQPGRQGVLRRRGGRPEGAAGQGRADAQRLEARSGTFPCLPSRRRCCCSTFRTVDRTRPHPQQGDDRVTADGGRRVDHPRVAGYRAGLPRRNAEPLGPVASRAADPARGGARPRADHLSRRRRRRCWSSKRRLPRSGA